MKRKKKWQSLVALFLSLCMAVGTVCPAMADELSADSESVSEETSGAVLKENSEATDENTGSSASTGFEELFQSQFRGETEFDEDETVTILVQLEDSAVLDSLTDAEITLEETATSYGARKMETLQSQAESVQEEVKAEVAAAAEEVSFENSQSYTLLLNGFTVEAPYSALKSISGISGVKWAGAVGSFTVPDFNEGIDVYTDSSSGLIDLSAAYDEGYTGQGTLIAILDTGIEYTHEAFASMPEGSLRYTEDDMAALIEEKGDQFNAKHVVDGEYYWSEKTYSDLVPGDGWYNEKIAFSYDYGDGDSDATADVSAHGVHVSGIAAGKAMDEDGTVIFSGVAPDAQLAAMKIFDEYSICETTTMLAALEDCVLLKADVINMSLGSASGFSSDASGVLTEVMESLEDAGIIVVVAAGNDTTTAANNPLSETGLPQVSNPDYGMVSSPSTYSPSLSVASVNNTKMHKDYFLSGDRKIYYADAGEGSLAFSSLDSEMEVVVIPGYGEYSDYNLTDENGDYITDPDNTWSYLKLDVAGKVVLVQRGGTDAWGDAITFQEKVSNAYMNDAAAILVYDNEDSDELITMGIDYQSIPAAFISKADGEALIAAAEAGNDTITVGSLSDIVEYDGAGEMSSFSSWGPGSTLSLKPEITAPGGNIYSSISGNTYGSYSGTSMAAPQIAGAAAILIQYVKETQQEAGNVSLLVRSLMMSTAVPVQDSDSGTNASVRQQGAGLVNVSNAVSTDAVLYGEDNDLPKAEVGSSTEGTYDFSFRVSNFSERDAVYAGTANVQTEESVTINETTYFSNIPRDITEQTDVVISLDGGALIGDAQLDDDIDTADARTIYRCAAGLAELKGLALVAADVVRDGEILAEDGDYLLRSMVGLEEMGVETTGFVVPEESDAVVSVSVALTDSMIAELNAQFTSGTYIEGYVTLDSLNGGVDLNLPYLGYLGDWSANALFDATVYDDQVASVYPGYLAVMQGPDYGWTTPTGNYLGYNYFSDTFDADRMYFNPALYTYTDSWGDEYFTAFYSELALLRNAEDVVMSVSDSDGNELYRFDYGDSTKSFYSTGSEAFVLATDPTYLYYYGYENGAPDWPEEGDRIYYTVTATPEGETEAVSYTFPEITIDATAPTADYDLVVDENGDFKLVFTVQDENYIQGIRLSGIDRWGYDAYVIGGLMGENFDDAEQGAVITEEVSLAEIQDALAENENYLQTDYLIVEVVDYAWNVTRFDIRLEGGVFTTEGKEDGTLKVVGYAGLGSSIIIPETIDGQTVTEIGEGAFEGLSTITSAEIPDTVTVIGANAFRGCRMEEIHIPASVVEIGEYAFGYDSDGNRIDGFTMYVYPGSAGETYALENEFDIVYIDDSGLLYRIDDSETAVTIVGYEGDSADLIIPSMVSGLPVTEIGEYAFYGNTTFDTVSLPDTLKAIRNRAFMYTELTTLDIPAGVTEIGVGAFASMYNLEKVVIPAGITELPYMVFSSDYSLTSVRLPEGLTSIGDNCFYSCSSLTEIDIPDSVTSIGECVFQFCSSLQTVNWPAAVTTIGYGVFQYCYSLEEFTVPEGVEVIYVGAFSCCGSLKKVSFPSTLTEIGADAFEECYELEELIFAEEGSDFVIGDSAFMECVSLSSITLPGRCTRIEETAFLYCTALEEVHLSEGLTYIGERAFATCNLTSVTIPRSVTTIGGKAFGYYWDEVDGFIIYGYSGTAAEAYANEYDFITFITLDE